MDTSIQELRARRAELIQALSSQGRNTELRRFAVLCARRTDLSGTDWNKLVEAAEQHALGGWSLAEMLEVRNKHAGAAIAACVVGLNRGASNAAAFLSAWQSTREDPAEAARDSARMAAIWGAMRAGSKEPVEDQDAIGRQVEALEQCVSH